MYILWRVFHCQGEPLDVEVREMELNNNNDN